MHAQVQAYRNLTDVPQTRDLQVMVDTRAEAVLVPIYGVMVPLHITTVRNVNHTAEQESSAAVIRISLNFG
jgi:nucleosome binding factor SPN SPT16 subunit